MIRFFEVNKFYDDSLLFNTVQKILREIYPGKQGLSFSFWRCKEEENRLSYRLKNLISDHIKGKVPAHFKGVSRLHQLALHLERQANEINRTEEEKLKVEKKLNQLEEEFKLILEENKQLKKEKLKQELLIVDMVAQLQLVKQHLNQKVEIIQNFDKSNSIKQNVEIKRLELHHTEISRNMASQIEQLKQHLIDKDLVIKNLEDLNEQLKRDLYQKDEIIKKIEVEYQLKENAEINRLENYHTEISQNMVSQIELLKQGLCHKDETIKNLAEANGFKESMEKIQRKLEEEIENLKEVNILKESEEIRRLENEIKEKDKLLAQYHRKSKSSRSNSPQRHSRWSHIWT